MRALRLRFPKSEIHRWAVRYGYTAPDSLPAAIGASARKRGHLTRAEFLALANWKSPRTRPRCAENSAEFVRDVTSIALSTKNEQLAIEILILLRGVSWPTASVILHFCAARPYPVLDFRALWSLSCTATPSEYDFALWHAYAEFTRKLATEAKVDMRTLDRALWGYSKENQPR